MAGGVNKVSLGQPWPGPETRYRKTAPCYASVATSESWRARTLANNKSERNGPVVFFGREAEIAGEFCEKVQGYIEGQLRTSSWEADGQKKYRTEVKHGKCKCSTA
ncbi:MAG: hypothetical protein CM15mP120_25050 [Pseudomonadota bacterium]|nr:MAG: hypothetical protein CM15mP120_25050 [Pseudomonadota bacterium]